MRLRFRYGYKTALVYLAVFAGMILLNFTMRSFEPFSLPLFAAALVCGLHPLALAGMYILAGGLSLLAGAEAFYVFLMQGAFLGGVFFAYERAGRSMRAEFALWCAVALLPFLWRFGGYVYADYIRGALVAAAIFLLCLLFLGAGRCLLLHAGRRKLSPEELIFLAAGAAAVGVGLYNCLGESVYQAVALFLLLLSCALLRNASAVFCALVLGIAPAVCRSVSAMTPDLYPIAAFCLCAAAALLLLRSGKLPCALGAFFADVLLRTLSEGMCTLFEGVCIVQIIIWCHAIEKSQVKGLARRTSIRKRCTYPQGEGGGGAVAGTAAAEVLLACPTGCRPRRRRPWTSRARGRGWRRGRGRRP